MLEVRGLTKRYAGLTALNQVSFDLHPGEIVGYLGPNGSGKSTTVNLVVGLLQPSAGSIALDGLRLSTDAVAYKRRLGYVPEEPYLYPQLTAAEYLTLVGRLRGLRETLLVDFAQAARGNHDVRREPALDVVARHLLRGADRGQAALARVALSARQHGRHDHRLADPRAGMLAGRDDASADLVAERERQRMVGPHPVVEIPEVRVAHTAPGNLDHDLAGSGLGAEGRACQRCVDARHLPAIGMRRHGSNAK